MATNKQTPAEANAMAASSSLREEETDDGWVVLPEATTATKPIEGKPPRPPRRASPMGTAVSSDQPSFDPTPDDIVGRYLPMRRALRCSDLPRQIHDADVYGAHPKFLATVYPAANDRFEWFFFVCHERCPMGWRRAGNGAYRLEGKAELLGGDAYCHSFRFYEDMAEVTGKKNEWRMDEYGTCGSADHGAGAAFDMVVCKVYPARGGVIHERLGVDRALLASQRRRADADVKPQVLVQLYLASLNLGDPLRCRMYPAVDICAAHPAVLTVMFPAANDRCEWFFAVRRTRAANGDGDGPLPRRAGPGAYVPVRECRVADSKQRRDVGYRRVFLYQENDATVRRVSRTEWWMEEYGFGRDFPYSELPAPKVRGANDEELVMYKLYVKLAVGRR